MTNRVIATTLLAAAAMVAGIDPTFAGAKTTRTAVTSTIADTQNGQRLRIGSDTQGAYVTTYVRRQIAVSSAIERYQTGTDWMLTTYYGINHTASNRAVYFDLSEPASPDTTAPMAPGTVQAHLIAKCRIVNVDMYKLAPGASTECPGSFRFQAADGSWYRFSFQPENFPQVNRMSVTCLSADSGGCKVWTIQPASNTTTGDDPNPKSLNTLLRIDGTTEEILEVLGDYYLSFKFTVAR